MMQHQQLQQQQLQQQQLQQQQQRQGNVAYTVEANFWEGLSDLRRRAPKSECPHRVGPAPREDVQGGTDRTADIGTLDSDIEEEKRECGLKRRPTQALSQKDGSSIAGNKALIIYFSKLAKKTNVETIDYKFLDSLFKSGATVNACDKYGQTALYEVARNWNVDVARFLMKYGAELNHKDKWGRTPLHLAAAVNHFEMVEFLIKHGGDINAKTNDEEQSPIHYAAKYNAVGSLKVIIENRGKLNARDYKKRTPVFLAAEMGQQDSARFLVEFGAPVGVFDDTGMSCIGCMVEKMPHVAIEALNQFRVTDYAFRKEYYYLNYLEYDPQRWRAENNKIDAFGVAIEVNKAEKKKMKREQRLACPTTALHLAVEHQDIEIIMHPVVQMLIKQKWNSFGRFGAIFAASIHLLYIMIWTWLAIFLPKGGDYYRDGIEWKLFLEVVGVVLTFYFILKLIWESKISFKDGQKFRRWRCRQINRDLQFCHPRWAQEKTFLESELKSSRSSGGGIMSDPWNIIEFVTYLNVVVVIITRIAYVFVQSAKTDELHRKTYSALLIFMWLHFMKSCRPFTALGPFISMLGHVIHDTMKFTFLFFEFFIPYAAGFWILFGGYINAKTMADADGEPVDWEKFHDSIFSVLQVTLGVGHNMDGLVAIDRLMAQILVGTYYALSTVMCMNLYIALLTETFNQVYHNAKANASLLQATTILQIEKVLSKKRRHKAMETMQEECGPLITAQEEDEAGFTEEELWDGVIRRVLSRFIFFNDFIKKKFFTKSAKTTTAVNDTYEEMRQRAKEEKETYELYQLFMSRDKEFYQILCDIHYLKCAALTYLGEGDKLPPKPRPKTFPVLNIKPPNTNYMAQLSSPQRMSAIQQPQQRGVDENQRQPAVESVHEDGSTPSRRPESAASTQLSVNWGEVTSMGGDTNDGSFE